MPKTAWNEVRELPVLGQIVMICGRTYRQPPYSTRYELARYVGERVYPWIGMDGIVIRGQVLFWRELDLYELPDGM